MPDQRRVDAGLARRIAVIEAGHTGDVGAARMGLDDHEPAVRAAALGSLQRCSALTVPDLERALTDVATVVRRAIELSAQGPESRSLDCALAQRLVGDDHVLAELAAWALGERHEETESAPDLVIGELTKAAVDHPDALVREAAVASLGSIGDQRGLAAVLSACSDKATVRRRAVIALAAFEGPEVEAALRAATRDRDWQVRQAAEDLVSE